MKWLKGVLLALLASLLVGLVIGTLLRWRLERSAWYIGSASAPWPLDVVNARAPILDARHHEQQIGKPV